MRIDIERKIRHTLILLSILLFSLIFGCGSNSIDNNAENSSDKGIDYYDFINVAYWDVTEFGKPSEDWIKENLLEYSYPVGIIKPNKIVGFNMVIGSKDVEVRFQTSKLDKDYKISEILDKTTQIIKQPKERIEYSYQLSSDENVLYLITAEFIEEGVVKNTVGTFLYVPIQELKAELQTNKKQYKSNQDIEIKLINKGRTYIQFGEPYTIETLKNDRWEAIPNPAGFILPLYEIRPNDTYTQKLYTYHLKSGRYRVLKEIKAAGTDLEETVFAEFTIK